MYAGGDRPFFEDAISNGPVVYMIHNMLTGEECEELIQRAEGRYDRVTKDANNYLENTIQSPDTKTNEDDGEQQQLQQPTARNVDRVTLWKGGIAGKFYKDIDESKVFAAIIFSFLSLLFCEVMSLIRIELVMIPCLFSHCCRNFTGHWIPSRAFL